MNKTRVIKFLKKLHKWPAIIIALIAILFAVSGIVMNHRQTFSSVNVSRKFLPAGYTYKNWNQSAIRGAVQTSREELLYGNIGVWKSVDNFKTVSDFNQGFPKGIDNRKVYSVKLFQDRLFAGTHFGLYKRNLPKGKWQKIKLPVNNNRITDLEIKNDTLLVLTRDYLLLSNNGNEFKTIQLPEPINYEHKTGLFNTFWELHSGELFGLVGKLVVDLLGVVTIVLSITGLLHFFLPKIIRRKKRKEKPVSILVQTKKKNLRWHNVVGYIFVLFLIINTFLGMHLRPPLLIAIAKKQVDIIPGTHLDNPNPWFDKLRRVHWDEVNKRFIFSTSDGFYFAEKTFSKKLLPALSQPPVSVMGCNVLESLTNNKLLVGSFSGMFVWNTQNGIVTEYFTQKPYVPAYGLARPIAENMVAGLVQINKKSWWFDYNRGAMVLNSQESQSAFIPMPETVLSSSPMSLWNVSQEIHTGRIFEHLVGGFYILFVPLAGICILLVLISGFFMWWMVYKKRGMKVLKN
ncbi:MAG: PepSY-associated TM helix domain-containing protein [Bacteroidota bacterium]